MCAGSEETEAIWGQVTSLQPRVRPQDTSDFQKFKVSELLQVGTSLEAQILGRSKVDLLGWARRRGLWEPQDPVLIPSRPLTDGETQRKSGSPQLRFFISNEGDQPGSLRVICEK